jgi:hypothetical protein
MVTKKNADNGPSNKKTRTMVEKKDAQMAYMLEGLDGVKALNDTVRDNPANYDKDGKPRNISKKVLWEAVDHLSEKGKGRFDLDPLTEWIESIYGERHEGQGKTPPQVGDTRTYKAQQLATGDCFLRLPIGPLDVEKGAGLRVTFKKGSILVENEEG